MMAVRVVEVVAHVGATWPAGRDDSLWRLRMMIIIILMAIIIIVGIKVGVRV